MSPRDAPRSDGRSAGAAGAPDVTPGPPPERIREILDERARRLARATAEAPDAGPGTDGLIFTVAEGRYAIETRFVREVIRLGDTARLPGASELIHGLINFRGEFLMLVDLGRLLRPGTRLAAATQAIVLGTEDAELSILAHRVDEVAVLAADTLDAPFAPSESGTVNLVRGIARDGLIVLNGAALLADRRLLVDETETTGLSSTIRGIDR